MSRHRNIRNLDEDDYYDDDYDDYYEEDYDDEDEYYLEQQREKERKAKLEAEKKAKANQAKQLQQQKKTAAATTTSQSSTTKSQIQAKGNTTKTGGINSKGISIAKPAVPKIDVQTTKSTNNNDEGAPPPKLPNHILTKLRSESLRTHLSLVILGHVDAGKSTLTGRLLLSLHHVSSRMLQRYQKESATIGKSSFALAWFTDEDESERERGVTVDVGTKFITTDKFDFTVLDAPGHRDFVPNMISGAAGADCALLVVAATTGEFEAGFASGGIGVMGGQTREHIILSRGLGVSQFIVAVNKLDAAEPSWDEGRFEYIKEKVLAFLLENGFKEKRIRFVPVSGLTGVNVCEKEKNQDDDDDGWRKLRHWYKGPTLIEALNSFMPAKREFEKPLRCIVTDVASEGKAVTLRGRIVQGFLRSGDGVVLLPVGDDANISRVERGKATKESDSPYAFVGNRSDEPNNSESDLADLPELQNCALAGDTVECSLTGVDAARVSPGCVICHPQVSVRPRIERKFEARVMVMEQLAVPIIRGSQVLFHMHSIDVPAVLNKLMTSKKRGESTPRNNPRVLSGGVEATVEITLAERLVLEEYSECKSLGRFVLRRGGDTIAIGLIEKIVGK